jgi:hypothetical protein
VIDSDCIGSCKQPYDHDHDGPIYYNGKTRNYAS